MLGISTTSTPSSVNSRPNFCVPPTSGREPDLQQDGRQERFSNLRECVRGMDKPPEAEEEDPYRRFVALCRKFHGQRTNKGHSFHAKKLRWLWYLSNGKNGAFGGLWTTNGIQRTRYRNDEC